MKDDRLYLIHIQEAIERIEEYTRDWKEFFLDDRKTQDAVLRNLHTLAQSSQRISNALKELIRKWTGASSLLFEMLWCMII